MGIDKEEKAVERKRREGKEEEEEGIVIEKE